jgi:hypothetical protein
MQSVSTNIPIIISSWRLSPYIILVWSDAAFEYITSSKNKCIQHKKNDSMFHVQSTFAIVHTSGGGGGVGKSLLFVKHAFGSSPVLIYNASKLSISLTSLVKSNTHVRFFSLNQPHRVSEANVGLTNTGSLIPVLFENQAVHALYPLIMNSKPIAVEHFDRELLDMVAYTQLTAQEEERLVVVYPNDYEEQQQQQRDEFDFEIFN